MMASVFVVWPVGGDGVHKAVLLLVKKVMATSTANMYSSSIGTSIPI